MYAIRTYNHGEFFYTISARKLSAEADEMVKIILEKTSRGISSH